MMMMMMMMMANLEKIMIEKAMAMMLMVTMVDVGFDSGGDEDNEKNGVIRLLAQMKDENRQREMGYEAQRCCSGTFTCATRPGPVAGGPPPPASPRRQGPRSLLAFLLLASVQALVWPWPPRHT